jgi:Rad3-related DNA helicase
VVLIDEAHNLVEAIKATHTRFLTHPQLTRGLEQITLYWQRYGDRLSGGS